MKGMNIQFDNLINLLQKNIDSKQVTENRDSFDMIYQKVTLESLKLVNIIFDDILDDFSVKLSYSKLLKQLKTFLALKPLISEDQEDDQFDKQYNQLQHFMNSRKPVQQIDQNQRGDIFKFLVQAQTKQKDIDEFMGNINKFKSKGSRNFLLSSKKLKSTMKNITLQVQEIATQTHMSMSMFQKLQSKFPKLMFTFNPASGTQNENNNNGKSGQSGTDQFDFEAKLNEMLRQKIQQIERLKQEALRNQSKLNQNAQQQKKQQIKKKIIPNKRNSEINMRRNSSVGNSLLKGKAGLSGNKKLPQIVSDNDKNNSNNKNNLLTGNTKNLQKIQQQNNEDQSRTLKNNNNNNQVGKILPSIEQISKLLVGIGQSQIKTIYEAIKSSIADNIYNLKPQTLQKQVNTVQQQNNLQNITKDKVLSINKTKTRSIKNKDKPSLSNGTQSSNSQKIRESQVSQITQKQIKQHRTISNNKNDKNQKSDKNYKIQKDQKGQKQEKEEKNEKNEKNDKNDKSVKFQSKSINCEAPRYQNSIIEPSQEYQDELKNTKNQSEFTLPQLSKSNQMSSSKFQSNQSGIKLVKQGKSAEQYLKKLKDTKYLKSIQSLKQNKQNYSLDMYKTKKQPVLKGRTSQALNLPSLNRASNIKSGVSSLHQEVGQPGKREYFKKVSTKFIAYDSLEMSHGFEGKECANLSNGESHLKKGKRTKSKDLFKQQERIMKQLQRISCSNNIKSNMKNIYKYIQFIESVHHGQCGQKCIHLQRFYEFLKRKNLPNRKQLLLHKTDMNVNLFV